MLSLVEISFGESGKFSTNFWFILANRKSAKFDGTFIWRIGTIFKSILGLFWQIGKLLNLVEISFGKSGKFSINFEFMSKNRKMLNLVEISFGKWENFQINFGFILANSKNVKFGGNLIWQFGKTSNLIWVYLTNSSNVKFNHDLIRQMIQVNRILFSC